MRKIALLFFMFIFTGSILNGDEVYYYGGSWNILLTKVKDQYSFIPSLKRDSKIKMFLAKRPEKILSFSNGVYLLQNLREDEKQTLKADGNLFAGYRRVAATENIFIDGTLTLKIKEKLQVPNVIAWAAKKNLTFVRAYKYLPDVYTFFAGEKVIETAKKLVEEKIVIWAEPNFIVPLEKRSNFIPNDTYFKNQWHLYNDGSNTALQGSDHAHVAEAWKFMIDKGYAPGEGVTIGIIDDGFDLDHEDFEDKWVNPKNFGSATDENMYFSAKDDEVPIGDAHGTACAGVAAANYNNGKGIAGACPLCKIVPVRVNLNAEVIEKESYDAFEYLLDQKVKIVSNSWGMRPEAGTHHLSELMKEMLKVMVKKGMIVFFSAGNGDMSGNPVDLSYDQLSSADEVISIGASNAAGKVTSYSNFGKKLDIVAPSSDIRNKTLMDGIWTTDNGKGDGYNPGKYDRHPYLDMLGYYMGGDEEGNYADEFGGTSSSAPLVAGIAALLLTIEPEFTFDEIYEILTETADKIHPEEANYNGSGHSEKYGYGRVNALRAVQLAYEIHEERESNQDADTPEPEDEETQPDDSAAESGDKDAVPDDNSSEPHDNGRESEKEEKTQNDDDKGPENIDKDSGQDENENLPNDEDGGCSILLF